MVLNEVKKPLHDNDSDCQEPGLKTKTSLKTAHFIRSPTDYIVPITLVT